MVSYGCGLYHLVYSFGRQPFDGLVVGGEGPVGGREGAGHGLLLLAHTDPQLLLEGRRQDGGERGEHGWLAAFTLCNGSRVTP